MRERLTRLLVWCLRKLGVSPKEVLSLLGTSPEEILPLLGITDTLHIDPNLRALIVEAAKLCLAVGTTGPHTSGEYKRHQVLARMIKKFPASKHSDIGLAIELALREIGG